MSVRDLSNEVEKLRETRIRQGARVMELEAALKEAIGALEGEYEIDTLELRAVLEEMKVGGE